MQKNILYVPQFSMSAKDQMFIDKDGNFIVLKTILKFLTKFSKESENGFIYNVNILIPERKYIVESVFFNDINKVVENTNVKITFTEFPFRFSPIENRYHFNFEDWKKVCTSDIDIVFNNIPEISRNMRSLFANQRVYMISLHHFTDYIKENKLVSSWENGNLFSYFWRQFDAMLCSDINVFNCESSMLGWIDNVGWVISKEAEDLVKESKGTYVTYTDLDEYKSTSDKKFEEFTTVYPSRITSSMYTNWPKVFQLFNDDKIKGRVIITNPSFTKGLDVLRNTNGNDYIKHYTEKVLKLDDLEVKCLVSWNDRIWIVNEQMERERYLKICSKSHVGLNLYFGEYYGGIAMRETIGYGSLIPVVPNIFEFSKWLKNEVNENIKFNDINQLDVNKYNEIASLYGTEIHTKILENFKSNEHYLEYYDRFIDLMQDIHKTDVLDFIEEVKEHIK